MLRKCTNTYIRTRILHKRYATKIIAYTIVSQCCCLQTEQIVIRLRSYSKYLFDKPYFYTEKNSETYKYSIIRAHRLRRYTERHK